MIYWIVWLVLAYFFVWAGIYFAILTWHILRALFIGLVAFVLGLFEKHT